MVIWAIFLRGNVGINQLKPQHEFFDAIGLEKVLNDNTQYHFVLTLAQAKSIIEDISPSHPQTPSHGEAFARGTEAENLSYGDEFARGTEVDNKKKILWRMYFLSQILFPPMREIFMIHMGFLMFAGNLRG